LRGEKKTRGKLSTLRRQMGGMNKKARWRGETAIRVIRRGWGGGGERAKNPRSLHEVVRVSGKKKSGPAREISGGARGKGKEINKKGRTVVEKES